LAIDFGVAAYQSRQANLACATLSGRPGIIELTYGPDGKTVTGVTVDHNWMRRKM
jgi:hypothetical protein